MTDIAQHIDHYEEAPLSLSTFDRKLPEIIEETLQEHGFDSVTQINNVCFQRLETEFPEFLQQLDQEGLLKRIKELTNEILRQKARKNLKVAFPEIIQILYPTPEGLKGKSATAIVDEIIQEILRPTLETRQTKNEIYLAIAYYFRNPASQNVGYFGDMHELRSNLLYLLHQARGNWGQNLHFNLPELKQIRRTSDIIEEVPGYFEELSYYPPQTSYRKKTNIKPRTTKEPGKISKYIGGALVLTAAIGATSLYANKKYSGDKFQTLRSPSSATAPANSAQYAQAYVQTTNTAAADKSPASSPEPITPPATNSANTVSSASPAVAANSSAQVTASAIPSSSASSATSTAPTSSVNQANPINQTPTINPPINNSPQQPAQAEAPKETYPTNEPPKLTEIRKGETVVNGPYMSDLAQPFKQTIHKMADENQRNAALNKINELHQQINRGAYASYMKRFAHRTNAELKAIIQDKNHTDHNLLTYLMQPGMTKYGLGPDIQRWQTKVEAVDQNGKPILENGRKKYINYEERFAADLELFEEHIEKEFKDYGLDKRSPGNIHMGARKGDKIATRKDGKYLWLINKYAEIANVDLSNQQPSTKPKTAPISTPKPKQITPSQNNTLNTIVEKNSVQQDTIEQEEIEITDEDIIELSENAPTQKPLNIDERLLHIKQNRREALLKNGEIHMPKNSENTLKSVLMAYENGFIKECDTDTQQEQIQSLLEKFSLQDLVTYKQLPDGSTYAKLSAEQLHKILQILDKNNS